MKTYMPLNGLRWSRNSGSANCDMPQSAVFGRPGGGKHPMFLGKQALIFRKQTLFSRMQKIRLRNSTLKFGKHIACFRCLILQMKRAE